MIHADNDTRIGGEGVIGEEEDLPYTAMGGPSVVSRYIREAPMRSCLPRQNAIPPYPSRTFELSDAGCHKDQRDHSD